MPGWAWLLVVLGVVGLIATVAFFWWAMRTSGRMRADILERGDDAAAWIVDVEPPEGMMWAIALVLVSPDRSIPDDDMRALAEKLQSLRDGDRKPANKAEREAVRVTKKQLDNPSRERLPDGFTGGREVYSFFMDLGPGDDENLPKGALDGDWFPVRVIWDEYPTMMIVPPREKKKRRRD